MSTDPNQQQQQQQQQQQLFVETQQGSLFNYVKDSVNTVANPLQGNASEAVIPGGSSCGDSIVHQTCYMIPDLLQPLHSQSSEDLESDTIVNSDEEFTAKRLYGAENDDDDDDDEDDDEDDDDDEEDDDDDDSQCSQVDLLLALGESQSNTTDLDFSAPSLNYSCNTSVTTLPTRNVPQTSQPPPPPTTSSNPSTPRRQHASRNATSVSVPSLPTTPVNTSQAGTVNTPTVPASANLFRYLRSALGRASSDNIVVPVIDNTNPNGNEDFSSDGDLDEDEDEASLYEEESTTADSHTGDESFFNPSTAELLMEQNATGGAGIDWNRLPVLPNRFAPTLTTSVHQTPPPPPYLDASLFLTTLTMDGATTIGAQATSSSSAAFLTTATANAFSMEHGVLLQAVLQLLAERDQVGVEGSMDSSDNIRKKGPLKKLSTARRNNRRVAGAWKVKYVELRHGNLCYYEDSDGTGRKTIHLRQADTVVQESTLSRNGGFVLELLVQGSPTRYWMASSEQEREEWIRAIQSAMIGDDHTLSWNNSSLNVQAYEKSLQAYTELRDALQASDSPESYLKALQEKVTLVLQVPVQWVRERIEQDLSPLLLGTLKPPKFWKSPQQQLKSSITDFWKNMSHITFSVNGCTVPRHSPLASERVVGALTRCILEFDKAYWTAAAAAAAAEDEIKPIAVQISELQAVSYARNILLNILRSKERQDAACAVKYLLETPSVAVAEGRGSSSSSSMLSSSSSSSGLDERVHIEISFAGEDLPDDFLPDTDEMASWVWTRRRRNKNSSSLATAVVVTATNSQRKLRHTFAVLSGTVLSYYAASTPRPHGLRGQLVLTVNCKVEDEGMELVTENNSGNSNSDGVTTSSNKKKQRYVLCISQEGHQDWIISFERQEEHASWKEALQLSIDSVGASSQSNNPPPPRVVTTTNSSSGITPLAVIPAKMLVKGAERAIDGTINGGIRVILGAKDQGIRVVKGAKDGGIKLIRTTAGSGIKVIRGAVGMLLPNKPEDGRGLDRSHPSMKMLLSNTDIVQGKRDPTVQCVVQTLQSFTIQEHNYSEHDGSEVTTEHSGDFDNGWISAQAKLYQAFLMSGGPSGRIAVGDALVDLEFLETNVEEEDAEEECSVE